MLRSLISSLHVKIIPAMIRKSYITSCENIFRFMHKKSVDDVELDLPLNISDKKL